MRSLRSPALTTRSSRRRRAVRRVAGDWRCGASDRTRAQRRQKAKTKAKELAALRSAHEPLPQLLPFVFCLLSFVLSSSDRRMNATVQLLHSVLPASVGLRVKINSAHPSAQHPRHRAHGLGHDRRPDRHHPDGELRRARRRDDRGDAARRDAPRRPGDRAGLLQRPRGDQDPRRRTTAPCASAAAEGLATGDGDLHRRLGRRQPAARQQRRHHVARPLRRLLGVLARARHRHHGEESRPRRRRAVHRPPARWSASSRSTSTRSAASRSACPSSTGRRTPRGAAATTAGARRVRRAPGSASTAT